MKTSQKLIDRLKVWEGFSKKPYECSAGKKTVGYGHVMENDLGDFTITEEGAEELLKLDLEFAEQTINHVITAPLTQNRYDALVSLVFNVGRHGFSRSLGLELLNSGVADRYELAAEQFFSQDVGFVYAGKSHNQGLVNRRQAELRVWRDGIYD